jgi:hypothetical protein
MIAKTLISVFLLLVMVQHLIAEEPNKMNKVIVKYFSCVKFRELVTRKNFSKLERAWFNPLPRLVQCFRKPKTAVF